MAKKAKKGVTKAQKKASKQKKGFGGKTVKKAMRGANKQVGKLAGVTQG